MSVGFVFWHTEASGVAKKGEVLSLWFMRATWTCLVGLEHHGVVSGGEQTGEVRGAGPSCGRICPLNLISGTQACKVVAVVTDTAYITKRRAYRLL